MDKLTERQVIGEFYRALSIYEGAPWIKLVSNYFGSDQASEEYAWLGQVPQMREWIGGRNAKGLSENSMTIKNVLYESTLEFLKDDMRRDKSGQIMIRIAEQAKRANTHWAQLLSTLILNGAASLCYDGQYFFDTDHTEGQNTVSQSNSITVDISDFAVATAGTVTVPSVAEMQLTIMEAITAIGGFLDNEKEPMNEDASEFLVMVPGQYGTVARQAVYTPVQVAETQTALTAAKQNFKIEVAVNPRLSSWYSSYQFVVFRTDSLIKSFIRQEEQGVQMSVQGKGSPIEFNERKHQYGIDALRNVGYGYWQNSCLVTMA